MKNQYYIVIIFIFQYFINFSQNNEIWMYPNEGQWDENVLYKTSLQNGDYYIDKQGFTFNFLKSPLHHESHHKRNNINNTDTTYLTLGHCIKSIFINANFSNHIHLNKSEHYTNYYLGSESSSWKSKIYGYNQLQFNEFYKGITFYVSEKNSLIEYSFRLDPKSSIKQIKQLLRGSDNNYIDTMGNLHITHRFGEIIHKKPIAWTISNRKKKSVEINFNLISDTLTFDLPNDYNNEDTLYIDPDLIFSTFTGSTSDNWGFTATPDNLGNLYAGGIVFGGGYPTQTGSYDISFNGGTTSIEKGQKIPGFDISLSKFNTDGSKMIFTTYLGGNGNETPHSIVSNTNNELFLLGASSSPNFPITPNAFDKTFHGGPNFDNNEVVFYGSDIIITKFSNDGSSLLGSTYLGGSGIDGLNLGNLIYNYGDNFRGEIILTKEEDILITSSTRSTDFPLKQAFQNQINGIQDAIVCKLDSDLSSLIWSSYVGGTGEETGNSIQISSRGDIYFAGGTTSTDLISVNGFQNKYQGGSGDGYIYKITSNNPTILNGSYFGTDKYDQNYFVQLDDNDEVYLLGQSEGQIEITPNKYGNPKSGQYISKLSSDLSQKIWSTTIGGGTGNVEISPTAFLVSHCYDIYFAGWGGLVNVQNSIAKKSTTLNFPVTDDAFQKTTTGDNFYIGVLSKDAEKLKYGTFMGGMGSNQYHVDGGTSRFDKKGGIYHAVCGGCGRKPNGFTTTTGVYSPTNKSNNCNLAAFKFELNKAKAIAIASDTFSCVGNDISFSNNSVYSDTYQWDFGDGELSNEVNPIHHYLKGGSYKVKLIAKDLSNCITPDTISINLTIKDILVTTQNKDFFVCRDSIVQFSEKTYDFATYNWLPSSFFLDNKIPNPTVKITEDIIIDLTITEKCATTNIIFPFKVHKENLDFTPNTNICLGQQVTLSVNNASSVFWTPSLYLDQPNNITTISKPDTSIIYTAHITTPLNCKSTHSTLIDVIARDYVIFPKDTVNICFGDSFQVNMLKSDNISWSTDYRIKQINNIATFTPLTSTFYSVNYTNACGNKTENIQIEVHKPTVSLEKDTNICQGQYTYLQANGCYTYDWIPSNEVELTKKIGNIIVRPDKTKIFSVIGKDIYNCKDTNSVKITVFEKPKVITSNTTHAEWDNPTQIQAYSLKKGKYKWSPNILLSCDTCSSTYTYIKNNQDYIVYFTDINGCTDSSITHIIFNTDLYIPNTFTPNNRDGNEVFKVEGYNIENLTVNIYNRWGELIYTLNSINDSWDGKYNGQLSPDGVYVWKATYQTSFGETKKINGHVNLLR